MTARLRYYVAASLDGYIATADGGVEWLRPFAAADAGFSSFIREIGGIFVGRGTYEKMLSFGPWPYSDRPTVVMTSRPLVSPPDGVEAAWGSVGAAIKRLRERAGDRDIWLIGGGNVAAQAAGEGELDQIELYSMPVILHAGLPLFAPGSKEISTLELVETGALKCGIVRSVYRQLRGAG